jgi:hypothetical protein
MVLVEGGRIKTECIPKRSLSVAWKALSNKPLPKIKAFRLSDKDFNQVLQHRHCVEDDLCEIEEWGKTLSTRDTDACIFNGDKNDDAEYIILVRTNPYHSLNEIIVHELSHIARGDL